MIPIPETVRLFPLGEAVLFPDTLLPLHVFEPRYRKLLADALDTDRTIGMALFRREQDDDGTAVYTIGCAGRIVEHEVLHDGCSLIVVRGTVKFRIAEELETDEPYRCIVPQALYEAPPSPEGARSWRDELRRIVEDLARVHHGDLDAVGDMFGELDVIGMVNYLSAALRLDVIEKQSLLECPTMEQRFARLRDLLEFKVAEARLGLRPDRDADA